MRKYFKNMTKCLFLRKKHFLKFSILNTIFCIIAVCEGTELKRDSQSRLEFVKDIIINNPDINMRTNLPDIYNYFKNDLNFVQQEIGNQKSRSFKNDILGTLDKIDHMVKENLNIMSFGYLNFVWGLVVDILSPSEEGRLDILINYRDVEENLTKSNQAYIQLLTVVEKKFKGSNFCEIMKITEHLVGPLPFATETILMSLERRITVSHVSRTGQVKITTINDGLSFTTVQGNYAIAFIGIGTNEKLSHDHFLNSQDAESLRSHDFRHLTHWHLPHLGFCNQLYEDKMLEITEAQNLHNGLSFSQRELDRMAEFKVKIAHVWNQPRVQYAIFNIFHEELNNSTFDKKIEALITSRPIEPTEGDIIGYKTETAMRDAEILMPKGFKFKRDTNMDFKKFIYEGKLAIFTAYTSPVTSDVCAQKP